TIGAWCCRAAPSAVVSARTLAPVSPLMPCRRLSLPPYQSTALVPAASVMLTAGDVSAPAPAHHAIDSRGGGAAEPLIAVNAPVVWLGQPTPAPLNTT